MGPVKSVFNSTVISCDKLPYICDIYHFQCQDVFIIYGVCEAGDLYITTIRGSGNQDYAAILNTNKQYCVSH